MTLPHLVYMDHWTISVRMKYRSEIWSFLKLTPIVFNFHIYGQERKHKIVCRAVPLILFITFICPHYKIEKKCFEFKPKNINISIKDLSIYAKQKFESELKVEKVVNLSLSFRKVSEVR